MSTIVIYGEAVQEARNRIRSVQVSVMFKVLNKMTFAEGKTHAAQIAQAIQGMQLPANNSRAKDSLLRAQQRISNFYADGRVQEVFALGDAIREVGEYIENGGVNDKVKQFESNLRNRAAFDKRSNRVRQEVPDYALSGWPPLGIFKNRLLDRSVVKYMERFYGPYIGADISGTTTDGLAVLALLQGRMDGSNIEKLAKIEAEQGWELPPIATMVLQYHHSLLECGLALALKNDALVEDGQNMAGLDAFNYYDLTSLGGEFFTRFLQDGNDMLRRELGGRRLVVLRDAIDIQDSPYADCEIGLLVEGADAVFDIGEQYQVFAGLRKNQVMVANDLYRSGDPSLLQAVQYYANKPDLPGLRDVAVSAQGLAQLNSAELKEMEGAGTVFADLDKAIAAARPVASAQADAQVSGTGNDGGAAVVSPSDLVSRLGALQPAQLVALSKMLSQ